MGIFDFDYSGPNGIDSVYFYPYSKDGTGGQFIEDFSDYYKSILNSSNVKNTLKEVSIYNQLYLGEVLDQTRISAKFLYGLFNLNSGYIDDNADSNSDRKAIIELNKAIYEKLFGSGTNNNSYRDFFYNYVIGFSGKNGNQKGISYQITSFPSKVMRKIRQETRNILKNQNIKIPFTTQGKNQTETNKKIFDAIRLAIQTGCIDVLKTKEPKELKQEFQANGKFAFKDFLDINYEKTPIKGGIIKYNISFNNRLIEIFSNFMYNVMLSSVLDYARINNLSSQWIQKVQKIIVDNEYKIKEEFFYGFKDLSSLSQLTDKKAIRGLYGEAITAALWRSIGANTEQLGGKRVAEYENKQPPYDILIDLENGKRTVRLQVKEWGSIFRQKNRLGQGYFNYKTAKNKNFFYKNGDNSSQSAFNIIKFLLIGAATFPEVGDSNSKEKIAESLYHLIPGFLRVAGIEDLFKGNLSNDLYLINGYYVPAYFFVKGIKDIISGRNNMEKVMFSSSITGSDLELKAEDAQFQGKRRYNYLKYLSEEYDPFTPPPYNIALQRYQTDNSNLLSTFSGTIKVNYKGVSITDSILKKFNF